jgi:hypothetical protein
MKTNSQKRSNTTEMLIGNIKYIITTHYNENGRETAEDKLLRLVAERISKDTTSSRCPA